VTIEPNHLAILQHAMGLDEFGRRQSHYPRNHFVTGPGCAEFDACRALVLAGMMVEFPSSDLSGGDPVFRATALGILTVQHESPAPPKLTRSQKRYLAFLEEDCDMKFGEWLRTGADASRRG
jgi:hypothetical protein